MRTSVSKYLGFTDREVREIFRDEEVLLLQEREAIEKKPKNHLITVKNTSNFNKINNDC